MEEHHLLPDHLLKIKNIRDQLKVIDRQMEEEDLVIITLNSLPSFENFIETSNITSNDELTFDQLSNKLLQKGRWRKQFVNHSGHDASDVVLAVNVKRKGNSNSTTLQVGKKKAASKIIQVIRTLE